MAHQWNFYCPSLLTMLSHWWKLPTKSYFRFIKWSLSLRSETEAGQLIVLLCLSGSSFLKRGPSVASYGCHNWITLFKQKLSKFMNLSMWSFISLIHSLIYFLWFIQCISNVKPSRYYDEYAVFISLKELKADCRENNS